MQVFCRTYKTSLCDFGVSCLLHTWYIKRVLTASDRAIRSNVLPIVEIDVAVLHMNFQIAFVLHFRATINSPTWANFAIKYFVWNTLIFSDNMASPSELRSAQRWTNTFVFVKSMLHDGSIMACDLLKHYPTYGNERKQIWHLSAPFRQKMYRNVMNLKVNSVFIGDIKVNVWVGTRRKKTTIIIIIHAWQSVTIIK